MKIYYIKVVVVISIVISLFLYWCLYGHSSFLNWFLPMGALVFFSMWAGGIYILHLSCRLDQTHRISKASRYDYAPELSEFRGCGTLYKRISKKSDVNYEFYCIAYLPIVPLGCYAVKKRWSGDKWYGYAQRRICEVLAIYMRDWGGGFGLIFASNTLFQFLKECN